MHKFINPKISSTSNCPCHSGKTYADCCAPYHLGEKEAENAELLMRSRYSAYALGYYEYILRSTHPNHPNYPLDLPVWIKEIQNFSENTEFVGLKIHETKDGESSSLVTFTAILKQDGKDCSFTEQSLFEKDGHKWLYKDGVYLQ